jgi:NAD(P)-dependent dehydrogenase (short-subunit alcohol dehydrogenase family)
MESNSYPQDFARHTAVVTGAARGIGRAIAEHLWQRGAYPILVDREEAGIASLAAAMRSEKSSPVHTIVVDLGSVTEIDRLAREIGSLSPHVHILVNNAGIEKELSLDAVTPNDFDEIMAVNLRAPFLLTKALVPLFPETGGAIVNISSIHATHAFPNAIPYACSKAGMIALTRNLALELAERKIRVNAICPGYIDTPMWDAWLRMMSNPEEVAAQTTNLHPLGRRGLPADIAQAVAYLAGPQAEWVTGTNLTVDGGLTIRAHH